MLEQLSLLPERVVRRNAGMRRASDHADRKSPEWTEAAVDFFRQHAAYNKTFMTSDVRRAAEAQGFAIPPDKRAWGSAALIAAKCGIIRKVGFAIASDPKVHCSINALWASA